MHTATCISFPTVLQLTETLQGFHMLYANKAHTESPDEVQTFSFPELHF